MVLILYKWRASSADGSSCSDEKLSGRLPSHTTENWSCCALGSKADGDAGGSGQAATGGPLRSAAGVAAGVVAGVVAGVTAGTTAAWSGSTGDGVGDGGRPASVGIRSR